MTRKLFATSFLAGIVVIGGLAAVNAAHNPGELVTPMSNSTTTVTTSSPPPSAPMYPGHMGY